MEYKVLYRKYRPDSFENIVDQDYIITILNNSIKNNKISHAYIFSGPRGTGKTSTAKVFAKAVNCLNPKDTGPCGECDMCKIFNSNTDIIELDAASNNGVDEIREIIDNVKLAPSYSKYKVYIIDEVHMLTQNAFNALLLTLEEPPSNVIFIMATTNIENVPVTILSRCQRFDFKKISYEALVSRLKYVCEQENINITDEAVGEIAKLADGGMRDALSILDQVQQENTIVDLDAIQKIYGIVPNKLINDLIDLFNSQDTDGVIKHITEFQNLGLNYKTLVKYTINILRSKAISSINEKDFDSYNKYKCIILELNRTINEANVYVNPFILYEIAFLNNIYPHRYSELNFNKFIIPEKQVEIANSKQTKTDYFPGNKKEEGIQGNQNYFPGNNFEQNQFELKKKIRVNNCFVNPQKEILNYLKNTWPSFIDEVTNNQILSLIIDTTPVAASDKVIIITASSIGTTELINLETQKIENELKNYYKTDYFVIAITQNEWDEYRKKYILDIKNGIKYQYKEEPKEEVKESDDIEAVAKNIFSEDKIEIN